MPPVKVVAVVIGAILTLLALFGFVLPALFSAASTESVLLAVIVVVAVILIAYYFIAKVVNAANKRRY